MLSSIKFTILATLTAQFASLSVSLPSPEHQLQERFVPITLGAAAAYGALAGTTLTSTGNSLITGNCGTCPGTSITGFPPGICTGTTSAGGTVACVAEAACLSAFNNAKAATPTIPLVASDLGGLTLSPGVYTFRKLKSSRQNFLVRVDIGAERLSRGFTCSRINSTFLEIVPLPPKYLE